MKILHLGKYYHPFEGGIENFLSALLKAQHAAGISHTVLAHHHRAWQKTSHESFPEGQVVRVFTLCRLLFAPIAPTYFIHLKKLLATATPDLIHVHMPNLSAFWLLLLGQRLRIPVIVHWHADVISSRRNILLSLAYLFYRPLERKLLARAAAIIVTSGNYLESSLPLCPFREKCHVIPLALNALPDEQAGNDTRVWQHDGYYRILCVGRLTYYKGQQYLIEAVAALPQVELVLVGTGKDRNKYQTLVSRLDCNDRIFLFGHADSDQLEQLLATCDCLCLPSIERTEAFGLVLLEAMQHARPCICTDVEGSGMSWVVQHGVTGLVVNHCDSDALGRAIIQLNNNREKALEFGQAGYERYRAIFSMDRVADEMASLYNHVTNPSH